MNKSRTPKTYRDTNSLDAWESFWFTPSEVGWLGVQRLAFAALAGWYFLNYWFDYSHWYGDRGPLSTEQLGQLVSMADVASTARWYWTPLYWLSDPAVLHSMLALGLLSSVALAVGFGGRSIALVTWLVWLAIANRGWVLAEIKDIPLSIGLLGTVIAGATPLLRNTECDNRWNYQLALRWLQVNAGLLAVGIAIAQWANPAWRSGLALENLLGAQAIGFAASNSLLSPWMIGNAAALQWISGLVIGAPLLALPLWIGMKSLKRSVACKRIAMGLIAHSLLVGLISGEWAYAMGWMTLWMAFLPIDTTAIRK